LGVLTCAALVFGIVSVSSALFVPDNVPWTAITFALFCVLALALGITVHTLGRRDLARIEAGLMDREGRPTAILARARGLLVIAASLTALLFGIGRLVILLSCGK
jgi:hypothetical protein